MSTEDLENIVKEAARDVILEYESRLDMMHEFVAEPYDKAQQVLPGLQDPSYRNHPDYEEIWRTLENARDQYRKKNARKASNARIKITQLLVWKENIF